MWTKQICLWANILTLGSERKREWVEKSFGQAEHDTYFILTLTTVIRKFLANSNEVLLESSAKKAGSGPWCYVCSMLRGRLLLVWPSRKYFASVAPTGQGILWGCSLAQVPTIRIADHGSRAACFLQALRFKEQFPMKLCLKINMCKLTPNGTYWDYFHPGLSDSLDLKEVSSPKAACPDDIQSYSTEIFALCF